MKTSITPILASIVAAYFAGSSVQAQTFPNTVTLPAAGKGTANSGGSKFSALAGAVYNTVTINIAVDKPGDPEIKTTENSYSEVVKFIKAKVTNKEILTAMANDGLLGGTTQGWSLAWKLAGDGNDPAAGEFVATKPSRDDVPVPEALMTLVPDAGNTVGTYALSEKTDKQGNTKTTFSGKGYIPVGSVINEVLPLAGTGDYTLQRRTIIVEKAPIDIFASTIKVNLDGSKK